MHPDFSLPFGSSWFPISALANAAILSSRAALESHPPAEVTVSSSAALEEFPQAPRPLGLPAQVLCSCTLGTDPVWYKRPPLFQLSVAKGTIIWLAACSRLRVGGFLCVGV